MGETLLMTIHIHYGNLFKLLNSNRENLDASEVKPAACCQKPWLLGALSSAEGGDKQGLYIYIYPNNAESNGKENGKRSGNEGSTSYRVWQICGRCELVVPRPHAHGNTEHKPPKGYATYILSKPLAKTIKTSHQGLCGCLRFGQ